MSRFDIMDPEYAEIARERIAFWEKVDPNYETVPKADEEDERQGTLFGECKLGSIGGTE